MNTTADKALFNALKKSNFSNRGELEREANKILQSESSWRGADNASLVKQLCNKVLEGIKAAHRLTELSYNM